MLLLIDAAIQLLTRPAVQSVHVLTCAAFNLFTRATCCYTLFISAAVLLLTRANLLLLIRAAIYCCLYVLLFFCLLVLLSS